MRDGAIGPLRSASVMDWILFLLKASEKGCRDFDVDLFVGLDDTPAMR
jgi:hypothetical protein